MNVTALCPYCQTAYFVDHTLRGHLIRCPNNACKKIFTVPKDLPAGDKPAARAPAPPTSAPPRGSQRSGSVGEMVPVLPVEPAQPSAEVKPADGDWWQAAPPVRGTTASPATPRPPAAPPSAPAPAKSDSPWWRDAPPPVRNPQTPDEPPAQPSRRTQPAAETLAPPPRKAPKGSPPRPVAETQPMEAIPDEPTDQPRELPPGVWEPPPVRRGEGAVETLPVEEAPAEEYHRPKVGKRVACLVIPVVLFLTLGILGGVGFFVYQKIQVTEETQTEKASEYYKQGSYREASAEYKQLAEKFSGSPEVERYKFMAAWCDICIQVSDPGEQLDVPINLLDRSLKENKNNPYMADVRHDAGSKLLMKLIKVLAERNVNPADDKVLKVIENVEQLRRTVLSLGPDALSKKESEEIDTDLAKIRLGVRRWQQRQEVLAQLKLRAKEGPMDAIKRVRALLAQKERELPGIKDDAEVQAGLNRLFEAHFASVVYQPWSSDMPKPKRDHLSDDAFPLTFAPLLPTAAPGRAAEGDSIVLALARGVLYALKRSNGELVWVMRVGIDTTVLPQRVPVAQGRPELLLVLSADTQTLTALNVKGEVLWEYHIGKPVLGRPIIIEHRAYLAANDGDVHEIELARGKMLGRYTLGQKLTGGGAREGDSNLIYLPADDSCVYILDVAKRACANILYDHHPSGSLRSEPVLIASQGENSPGYLILNQANGLDSMQLRVFELPIQERDTKPLVLKPPPQLTGWTWFEPYQDGEKLAVLSDAGILGLFGIRQLGNLDQALFPLLKREGLDLSSFLQGERPLTGERGRAQVVHMAGNDLWVLAHGRFQQVRLRWSNAKGLEAASVWKTSLSLGSPLHEPQRIEDRVTGRSTFFLVTQALEQQICLATAVDEDGKILWQRQLGLVCREEPLRMTPPGGGAPLLLAMDQGGGLFSLDPPPAPLRPVSWPNIAPVLDSNPRVPPRLLLAPDGKSAYEIAAPGEGSKLVIRHIEWAGNERKLRVKQREVSLVSIGGIRLVPAGTPAVVGSQLIVPMTDGVLYRVPLPVPADDAQLKRGPQWRDPLAPSDAPCHVLALGGERFLATDGRKGLGVWEWAAGMDFKVLPPGDVNSVKQLPALVAAPPVVLPAKKGQTTRLVLVDSSDVLHLLSVAEDGSLAEQPQDKHELKGKLTAGPFLRELPNGETGLLCVLDQHQIVWLDATGANELWKYDTKGEAILGQPQFIEGMLVFATPSGRYFALDPADGKAAGDGYTLRASAAPSATPVSFGSGQMFTPLTDGTALLLPVSELQHKAKK